MVLGRYLSILSNPSPDYLVASSAQISAPDTNRKPTISSRPVCTTITVGARSSSLGSLLLASCLSCTRAEGSRDEVDPNWSLLCHRGTNVNEGLLSRWREEEESVLECHSVLPLNLGWDSSPSHDKRRLGTSGARQEVSGIGRPWTCIYPGYAFRSFMKMTSLIVFYSVSVT